MRRILFFILVLLVSVQASAAESTPKIYEPGIILHFVPRSEENYQLSTEEPLGSMVEIKSQFNAANFEQSKQLIKYGNMAHGLHWEGFFKALKSGKYVFSAIGASENKNNSYNGKKCRFDAWISGEHLFTLEGVKLKDLHNTFGRKTLELSAGIHQFEAWLACEGYEKKRDENYVELEVKRPGEFIVNPLKPNELLHKK